MLRSLWTAISGLSAHQQMLDVTANNIANVNTVGFKSSHAVFEDTLSQTIANATGPTGTSGGRNPQQVGLGVKLAATALDGAEGSAQATGLKSNLMINGDGFFVVNRNGEQEFTRAGAFTLDNAGHLVTPDGAMVDDTSGAPLDLSALNSGSYVSWNIDSVGRVVGVDTSGASTVLGQVGLAAFANPAGLQKVGDTSFVATMNSGAAQIGPADAGPRGSIASGYLEMSNVDLAAELTNLIVAQRGFQANSKVITTSDELLQTLVNLKQ